MDEERNRLIRELEQKFHPFTQALLSELRAKSFPFDEQQQLHILNLNERLVIRHALPYCITEEAFFELDSKGVEFFAAVLLLHTLALTRIDNYYDGGNLTKQVDAFDVHTLAYSLSATHEGILTLLKLAPKAIELTSPLKVTSFVHARMYKDFTERYQSQYLQSDDRSISRYLNSSTSRILGSGYWEVMARASFARRGKGFPAHLHAVDLKLRKFRQIIDELADVQEDLRGGLVTLPVLHILNRHPDRERIKQSIKNYWHNGLKLEDELPIVRHMQEAGTPEWIYKQAMLYYDSAMKELDDSIGSKGEGYKRLFDFKRIKLEMLAAN